MKTVIEQPTDKQTTGGEMFILLLWNNRACPPDQEENRTHFQNNKQPKNTQACSLRLNKNTEDVRHALPPLGCCQRAKDANEPRLLACSAL